LDSTGEQRATATPSVISRSALDELISELASLGFTVIGPTVRDRAILYEEISSTADLPYSVSEAAGAPCDIKIPSKRRGSST
jgi:sulfhydrogenase subunit beta (sulfur reductase)